MTMARHLTWLVVAGYCVVAAAGPVAATHSIGPRPVLPLISVESVNTLLTAGAPITLIDVRATQAYEVSRLPQARSVPLSELRIRDTEIPRSGLVVLYCACQPGEDWRAYELLYVRGHRNILVLAGGFSAWVHRGLPLDAG
jgi:rhodanese-related sulfurtransferase